MRWSDNSSFERGYHISTDVWNPSSLFPVRSFRSVNSNETRVRIPLTASPDSAVVSVTALARVFSDYNTTRRTFRSP
ncbi:MAG: hypothetical protein AAF791_03555 [Bacteroidota bacterium]